MPVEGFLWYISLYLFALSRAVIVDVWGDIELNSGREMTWALKRSSFAKQDRQGVGPCSTAGHDRLWVGEWRRLVQTALGVLDPGP